MFSEKRYAVCALLVVFSVVLLAGAVPSASAAPIVLKLSNVLPDGNPTTESMVFFVAKVKEKTVTFTLTLRYQSDVSLKMTYSILNEGILLS